MVSVGIIARGYVSSASPETLSSVMLNVTVTGPLAGTVIIVSTLVPENLTPATLVFGPAKYIIYNNGRKLIK